MSTFGSSAERQLGTVRLPKADYLEPAHKPSFSRSVHVHIPQIGYASATGAGAMPNASVGLPRRTLGTSAKRTAAIDNRDPARLGLDHQALEYAVSGKGDHVSRIERKHALVALEAGTRTQAHVEREA